MVAAFGAYLKHEVPSLPICRQPAQEGEHGVTVERPG
jgi:hypothetical protein